MEAMTGAACREAATAERHRQTGVRCGTLPLMTSTPREYQVTLQAIRAGIEFFDRLDEVGPNETASEDASRLEEAQDFRGLVELAYGYQNLLAVLASTFAEDQGITPQQYLRKVEKAGQDEAENR